MDGCCLRVILVCMSRDDTSSSRQIIALIIFLALCAAVAGIGSVATSSAMDGWYESLEQPSWNPADWLFGPVWTALYIIIALSAWIVWRKRGWEGAKLPLIVWGVQLGLNLLWTLLFFGMESPLAGLIEIVFLWLAIAATIAVFWPISRLAALMLVPYLLWVTYAGALNYSIWSLN